MKPAHTIVLLVAAAVIAKLAAAAPEESLVEIAVTDRTGPAEELGTDDFQLFEDGEQRPLVSVTPATSPRHLVLVVDLSWSSPGDRHRALPPLREFLLERSRRGDRVTIALVEDGQQNRDIDWLCRFSSDAREVEAALEALAGSRSVAFRARQQRGADTTQDLEDAYRALTAALSMIRGAAEHTSMLYLGQALAAGVGDGASSFWLLGTGGSEATDEAGSVQYLVSLPRSGPLEAKARGAGDRLLAAAIEAAVAVYPVVRSSSGSGLWLANETGGASLSIRELRTELDRMARELDHSYELRWQRQADSRFHRLTVETPGDVAFRYPRGYRAATEDERLAARAGAALTLGAETNPLGLVARITAGEAHGEEVLAPLELTLPAELQTGGRQTGGRHPGGRQTGGRQTGGRQTGGRQTGGQLTLHVALIAGDRLLSTRQQLSIQPPSDHSTLQLRIPLRLPAESREIGLALRDDASGRLSTLRVSVPEPRPVAGDD